MNLRSILIKYTSSNLGKAKRNFTPCQIQILAKRFEAKPYLEPGEKHKLAKSLNTSDKRIEEWFRYTRSRRRKQGLLREFTSNPQ